MSTRVTEPVDGVPGTCLIEAVDERGVALPGPLVALVAVVHGNEPVGDGVLARLRVEGGDQLKAGAVLAVRANLEAQRLGVRHTEDGVDLNRLWDRGTLASLEAMPRESLCWEERRALELAPLLVRCDAVLDLHSTSRPSAPFLVFRDDQRHASVARQLGVRNLVTGLHESGVLHGGVCSNVGLAAGEVSRRLGFTFEAGQHGDPGNQERAWWVAVRLLHQLGLWRTPPEPLDPDAPVDVYEVLDRFAQAPAGTKPWTFVPTDEASMRRREPRQLESFEWVHADEQLVRRGSTVVRAKSPFTMLMPAPDARPGADLYFTAQRRQGLAEREYRTNAEARREALAIEGMLDVLGDDEMEDGASWVAFDNRRCLDLCADLIGRTLRMAPANPHRRVTIVGRGDWGGDESERRDSMRYGQTLRRALDAGVPVERLQLLRGASLGWLASLTASGDGARLLLSVQQPHTVSLLVVGDLDRALETGDVRGVRVAVVIEAATVEPDEDAALVRVVRTGVISARPEVLRSARNVVRALREEHRALVERSVLLGGDTGGLLGPDGVVPDGVDVVALRHAVLRLQLRLWWDALRAEIRPGPNGVRELQLPNRRALGRWLAAVMSRTGILDVDALRRLLIRPSGAGWTVDTSRLERLVTGPADPASLDELLAGLPTRGGPPQPVLAQDVDGDDLDRWIGWKRWLRGHDLVPADRGKDLDLAFDEGAIRRRFTGWLRQAAADAAARPGEVLVVMAGDGMNPNRPTDATELLAAHRALLMDPNVRYLRIQHAQGTHLAWMKELVRTLAARPDGGEPVALLFEAEHGATVNVVMTCVRDPATSGPGDPWSLEGWKIERCAVVVSDLDSPGPRRDAPTAVRDVKLALFTERPAGGGALNEELLHVGRAHCEGLLKQGGWRAVGDHGAPDPRAVERIFCQHLERWVEAVRSLGVEGVLEAPPEPAGRADWVARQLGIVDRDLALALAGEIDGDGPAPLAASRVWAAAREWA